MKMQGTLSIIMEMGVNLRSLLFSAEKRELKAPMREFTFRGGLPRGMSALIVVPSSPGEFVMSLRALNSLLMFFSGDKAVTGDSQYAELLGIFFRDTEFVPLQDLGSFLKEKTFDVLWDMSRPPSNIWKYLPTLNFTLRIGTDPTEYPAYNIITEVDPSKPDGVFQEESLQMLLIPLKPFTLRVGESTRRKAWDRLLYEGHVSGRVLVFLDITDTKGYQRIKDYLRGFFRGEVTFLTFSKKAPDEIGISGFDLSLKLAALSLSDLYVGEGGFFGSLAIQLKVPQLYLPGARLRLPPSARYLVFEPTEENFGKALRELLSS